MSGPEIELTGLPKEMPGHIRNGGHYATYTVAGIREMSHISLRFPSSRDCMVFEAIGLLRAALLECESVDMGGHLTLTVRTSSAEFNGHLRVFGKNMREKLLPILEAIRTKAEAVRKNLHTGEFVFFDFDQDLHFQY